ncbi:hypothetical protein Mapa_007719 [Marchantia paleacea]|nr:hypothetical protein Mapa_007719 [Marchantia paleacea]
MMARISSVGPEAFSRTDRISTGFSSVIRDHMAVSSSRKDRLLGLASQPQAPEYDASSVSELEEEDIWGSADSRGWGDESPGQEVRKFDLGGYGSSQRDLDAGGEHFRLFNNGRRWLSSLEKDPGLSVAYAEGGRARGVGFPSPLNRASSNVSGTPTRDSRTPSRLIPNREVKASHFTQVSSAVENSKVLHQSAPVNVPDWSKILGTERKTKDHVDEVADTDNDDEDDERLPPHELIQRDYARSQITTFSMCEGAGRTLKGRDLSRVRNAVLRQTGFLGE